MLTQLEASKEVMTLTFTRMGFTAARWRGPPVSHWTAESRYYSILDAALRNRFDERPVYAVRLIGILVSELGQYAIKDLSGDPCRAEIMGIAQAGVRPGQWPTTDTAVGPQVTGIEFLKCTPFN